MPARSIATPPLLHYYTAAASCCYITIYTLYTLLLHHAAQQRASPCCCRCSARWGCPPAVPVRPACQCASGGWGEARTWPTSKTTSFTPGGSRMRPPPSREKYWQRVVMGSGSSRACMHMSHATCSTNEGSLAHSSCCCSSCALHVSPPPAHCDPAAAARATRADMITNGVHVTRRQGKGCRACMAGGCGYGRVGQVASCRGY
jgi:hypothetical protein